MKELFYRSVMVLLVVCALLQTGMLLRRELRSHTKPAEDIRVRDWRSYASGWILQGTLSAPVTIVEFSDFQCPYCRRLAAALDTVVSQRPRDIRVIYRFFPLERIHPFAKAAAIATLCAGDQGRLKEFHDELFSRQRDIGKLQWRTFAEHARVDNIPLFLNCLESDQHLRRMEKDAADAGRLGVTGTPTILVNERRYSGAVSAAELNKAIDRIVLTRRAKL